MGQYWSKCTSKRRFLDHCYSKFTLYLADNLITNFKLFADDTSLFSLVHSMNTSAYNLNNDLSRISDWGMQWQIRFNPDPSKQAQNVIFLRKRHYSNNLIYCNHNLVQQVTSQKHFEMHLDTKLNFQWHLDNIMSKDDKIIGLLLKLRGILGCPSLVTFYKAFIWHHLECEDIIYDRTYKEESFHQKLESIKYNAVLTITGAIRATSREKICQ